jgi:hypothetical protein
METCPGYTYAYIQTGGFRTLKKLVFALAAVCAVMYAQDDAAYEKAMKALGKDSGMVRKADPKTGAEIAAAAERMASAYETSHDFWTKRGGADAVKWSDDGKAAAVELASAAKAGDAGKAGSAFQKLGATCKQCHDAHREKLADGTYKIK